VRLRIFPFKVLATADIILKIGFIKQELIPSYRREELNLI